MSYLRTVLCAALALAAAAQAPKPVPRMQAVPLPEHQVSFQRDGVEISRYWYSPALKRPFVFPIIGPSGRALTRMGHPHDPEGHSHHNSVWISHHDVSGVDFWADRAGKTRIAHQRILRLTDGVEEASVLVENAWLDETGAPLLAERRMLTARALEAGEWLLAIDLSLEPASVPVRFGKTPFGLLGVCMAKSIGVNDGGGSIRNSEGAEDEPNVLWRRARWVDYSGPVAARAIEGITLFDHPANPNHPSYFHVRRDGWMGSSFSFDGPRTVERGKPLRLRYGLWVHAATPTAEQIEKRWREFAAGALPELAGKAK